MNKINYAFFAISIAGALSPSQVYAKDSFVINAAAKPGDTVYLVLNVIDDGGGKGFIRESANYGSGKTVLPEPIKCGETTRYFESWSRRHVGKLPEGGPGMRTGMLKASFSLEGAERSDVVPVDRQIKATLKEQSHFKGEDFSVQVKLSCN